MKLNAKTPITDEEITRIMSMKDTHSIPQIARATKRGHALIGKILRAKHLQPVKESPKEYFDWNDYKNELI